MPSEPSDRFRQAVYRAEDQWSSILDRGGRVDFFGSQLTAPVQLRFGSLDDVRHYVDRINHKLATPDVRVRERKGGTRAHYEVIDGACVIAIPTHEAWAMRESVVLHEISHHICASTLHSTHHDQGFTSTMLSLVEQQLGAEAALLLRTGYQAGGVPV